MRTGRCATLAEASETMGERRAQLSALVDAAGHRARRDRHAPVEPLAGPADHRHAALPPERQAPPLRRLAEQHLRAARPRRHPRRRPGDRRPRRPAAVPPAPARALRELAARRGREQRASLGAHGDLHAHVPALRRPGRLRRLGRLGVVRAAPLRDRLDRRAHADLVERPAAPRVPDGRDPDLRRRSPTSPSRARSRGSATRSPPGSCAPTTRASRCPTRRRG